MEKIIFHKLYLAGKELEYIKKSIDSGRISGDGIFTEKCQKFFENKFKAVKVLLTTSCTHALEMASLLVNVQPNDEVIVPSFTLSSTVNAFMLRGARPVFADIRSDTLNIDEKQIADKISSRTKAICPMHYAGVACEMDVIMKIAKEKNIFVIEDAAYGLNARYKDRYLGTIGDLGAYSFHDTKNYICGEGGALLINDEQFIERAMIIRDKGTDRSKFFRGEIDKYTWVDLGSSYPPSDILAAFLYGQLERFDEIANRRKKIFNYYYGNLKELETKGKIRLPYYPRTAAPNYSLFYVLLPSRRMRDSVMHGLKKIGIEAPFHYIPLHLSPMGKRLSYKAGALPITEDISMRILRLPFYNDLSKKEQDYIIDNLTKLA